jgi:hypothetical protein
MFQGSNRLPSPKPRAWLCLFLAALFLYNPFLEAPASAAGLDLRHSASNRATVGASELQQFTVGKLRHVVGTQAESPTGTALFLEAPREQPTAAGFDSPAPPVLWAANLWFRPPPLA